MPSTTKTQEPKVIRIPGEAIPPTDRAQHHFQRPHLLTVLLSLIALIALIHFIAVKHSAEPAVVPTTCQGLIRTTDYTQAVRLLPKSQEIGAVQIADQLVGGQPAALVQVMNVGSQHALDAYIYGCIIHKQTPALTTLFVQHNLIQGSIAISRVNTLITSELDTTLAPQDVTLLQPLQQNIYREYGWQNGTFVQLLFPSLYPVITRSEAEQLQQQANSGQSLPWSDPLTTAELMAKDLFKWSGNNPQDAVLNNDGKTAQVQLVQQSPQMQISVSLKRLVQQNNIGLWFVVGAQSTGITLEQPNSGNGSSSIPFISPSAIKGSGALSDGQSSATLFDHTLTPLSFLNNPTLSVDANGGYTGILIYTNRVPNQQGLLFIQSLPLNGSTEQGQLLLTGIILQ